MNIITNFFDIVLSKNEITTPYVDFKDREQLTELENSNSEAIFMRYRDRILFWGANSVSENGDHNVTGSDHNMFSNILAYSLLKQFYQDEAKIRISKKHHVYKIVFFDKDISNGKYQGLELYKTFHLHFAPLFTSSEVSLGFTISTSVTVGVSWEVGNFESEGIEYRDLRHDMETGEVFATNKARYRLANYFTYASQLKNELDRLNSIQNEFSKVNDFVENYFNKSLRFFTLPDNLQIKKIKCVSCSGTTGKKEIDVNILPEPESYFYNGTYPSLKNNFHKRQKTKFNKPFTYDEFENRTIDISIVYPKDLYQDVRRFFGYVQNELIDIYRLNKNNFSYSTYEIENFSLRSYQNSLSLIGNADLVMVVVEKAHEALTPSESPYYFCKAEFIKRGINTQEVQIEQIQKLLSDKKQKSANYTDHNIALNIYAKLGGMAWTVKPNYRRNELVIGIGATTDRQGQPVLGLTSIFRGDGKYILGKTSSVTNMVDYRDKLEQVVSSAIERSIRDGTLDTEQTFYLIFHIFKPAGRNTEISALKSVFTKFKNYSFEHAFVHLGTGHNYRFFTYAKDGDGVQPTERNSLGKNLRGTLIEVNRRRGFLGLRSGSSIFHKIDIHKESSFVDIEYIAEQIYQFSEMSHTSFNKQGSPITIKYSNLMAKFAEKFKEGNLTYLDETTMPDQSLWFI